MTLGTTLFSVVFRSAGPLETVLSVGGCVVNFLITSSDVARRRQTSYDVARLLLMVSIEVWRNSTPVFGAVVFCRTNIEDFRTLFTSTSLTISQKRLLRWTSSKRKIMEVIEVDQLEDTNNERLSWAMPHSGLKPKNENDSKEEDYLWWKITFDGRRPSMEDDLWWKTTFDGRWPLMEDTLWWETTFDRKQSSIEEDLWWKTTFDGRLPLMEDNLLYSSSIFPARAIDHSVLFYRTQ